MENLNWLGHSATLAHLALECLDLTELGDTCTKDDVELLCAKAQGFVPVVSTVTPCLPQVAAVCVWPAFVAQARAALPSTIRVAAVVNFPNGDESIEAVCAQVQQIRESGGQEVDCVLPYHAWLSGEYVESRTLVSAVRRASEGLTLKLILESGAFDDNVLLRNACDMALQEGVDFLKTSTGKIVQGASLKAADVLLAAITNHSQCERLGFKPSGGIRTVDDLQAYAQAVKRHLGSSALVPSRFRIGASGLWNDIARVFGQSASGSVSTTAY